MPSEQLHGFHMSNMWAGSNGMKCVQCQDRTYSVWLTARECEWLPSSRSHASQVICERKLGQVLCLPCAKKIANTVDYVDPLKDDLRTASDQCEALSKDNSRLRALLQKAHDEFAKTDHWYHSDIKEELAKELGL